MRTRRSNCRRGESARGAVLVHVAVALIGLLAFSALTIDYGAMWVSRRQAQNAADAAALAGGLSLAHDAADFDRARLIAKSVGESNKVFGGTLSITQGSGGGGISPADDISFLRPTAPNQCPLGFATAADTCIRVNVYRNAGNNPLPVFFAPLFGRTQQGVRATATAVITGGNATTCMRPFGLMDKWDEAIGAESDVNDLATPDPYTRSPGWDPDFYDLLPPAPPDPERMRAFEPVSLGGTDLYVPPSPTSPGTGFRLYTSDGRYCCDYGSLLQLRICNPGQIGGCYQPIDCGPNNCYESLIPNCDGQLHVIGENLGVVRNAEGLGARVFIKKGIEDLIDLDEFAEWKAPGVLPACPDGCVYSPTTGINASPRMVPLPVFNATDWANDTGSANMNIQNFIGGFVEGYVENGPRSAILLRLVPAPGMIAGGATVDGEAAFLKTVVLVR